MHGELGDQLHTQLGLRKLNEVVQDVSQPVVMLDALWLTIFEDGATRQTDRLGRQRVSTHAAKGGVSSRWGCIHRPVAGACWAGRFPSVKVRTPGNAC